MSSSVIFESEAFSSSHAKLIDFLAENEAARNEVIETNSDQIHDLMHGYQYPVSAWPIIVSQGLVEEYTQVVERFPQVFLDALDIFFSGVEEQFSDYFCIPDYSYGLFKNLRLKSDDFMIRHDFIFHQEKIKLIESNVGSTIGGWQLDWFFGEIERLFSKYPEIKNINFSRRNTFKKFFETLVYQVLKVKPDRGTINIVVPCIKSMDKTETKNAVMEFCGFDNQNKFKHVRVNIEVIYDLTELSFSADNYVFLNNKEVDVLLFTLAKDTIVTSQTSSQIFSAVSEKKLIFVDGLMTSVFGNKAMYALVHETKVLNRLPQQAVDFIRRYIPWTFRLNSEELDYQGQQCCRRELTKKLKDRFLIKKILSSQGENIHIGKEMKPFDWEVAVEAAFRSKDWIVQEYLAPDITIACSNNAELELFHMVWGIFDIGGSYQGAFVRGSKVSNDQGVINSATGALEFFVVEEDKLTKISL